MKVLIVWSGAVVPAYQSFFWELAKYMRVRVLAPHNWTHGSVAFNGATLNKEQGKWISRGCEILPVRYLFEKSSHYFVPELAIHLLSFRPTHLYIMDEIDRPALLWHSLLAKLIRPSVKIICYALQNLPKPTYYKWHHWVSIRANSILVSKIIAASEEAKQVLKLHAYPGAATVIPLWASESHFFPGTVSAKTEYRNALGIKDSEIVLLFSGSLVEAKGLLLLMSVLPRFPQIRLMTAGNGPLEATLRQGLGTQWIHRGGLSGEDLRCFYQSGDYIILPSVTMGHWKEQVGRSLIEGILCDLIALGSDSGNIPALTLFPETSFAQSDVKSLSNVLRRLPLKNAEKVREVQRKNVLDHYTDVSVALQTSIFFGVTQ